MSNNSGMLLAIASDLRARGLSIIPIKFQEKRPAVPWREFQTRQPTDAEIRTWFGNGARRNIGIVTGAVSGVVVVDCDSPEAIAWTDDHLPATPMITRTGRGQHRFFRHPGRPIGNKARVRTGDARIAIDVRGDGGYVVAPGSVHDTGALYERAGDWPRIDALPVFDPSWLQLEPETRTTMKTPAPSPAAPAVDHRLVLDRARKYLAATPGAVEGQAGDEHTFQVCCRLVRGFDLSDVEAFDLLGAWNARCVPPWPESELLAKIKGARAYGDEPIGGRADAPRDVSRQVRRALEGAAKTTPAIVVGASGDDRLTEAGAAERFARRHSDDVRFDHRRARWLIWQGHRWAPDADAAVTRLALDFARTWQRESVEISDRDRREATFKAAVRLERRDALISMLKLAADFRPIADAGDGWDTDPWLLGAVNGVVELQTGILRAGRREDRITMSAGTFEREARSERWASALRSILVSDETIDFVQTGVGYSATGDTRRDCWFLTQGPGRNGKGTILHPIRRALGDYAAELPAAVLDARREGAPYDLAILPGRRFVVSSESGDTIKLHHDRVKQISGGDPIRAANKYEKSFEFEPVCKLWLAANRKPRVTDDSPAFWARVMLVPFAVSFVGREDRALRPTLEHDPEDQAAILSWIVQGAVRYAEHGLDPPAVVTTATRSYEAECDPLGDFLHEACDVDEGAEVRASELFDHYKVWADRQGLSERERLNATTFGRRMGERFTNRKTERGKAYFGVARRSP